MASCLSVSDMEASSDRVWTVLTDFVIRCRMKLDILSPGSVLQILELKEQRSSLRLQHTIPFCIFIPFWVNPLSAFVDGCFLYLLVSSLIRLDSLQEDRLLFHFRLPTVLAARWGLG